MKKEKNVFKNLFFALLIQQQIRRIFVIFFQLSEIAFKALSFRTFFYHLLWPGR